MGEDRYGIYYWKCDRSDAFHGTEDAPHDQDGMAERLAAALRSRFGKDISDVAPGQGQGNHRTFTARLRGEKVFIRTEDGSEGDSYFAVEKAVTDRVAALGVPVPRTIDYDVSRSEVPFAWQIIPFIDAVDLNSHFKAGTLDWTDVAPAIGRAIAVWQEVSAPGFGPFSARLAAATGELKALHPSPEAYFRLNLEKHMRFLSDGGFLSPADADRIRQTVDANISALAGAGVLVHKDVALWNILGTERKAVSFIDWDDAIIGDAMDDLSLLACFHGYDVLSSVIRGYETVRPLPQDAARRFWLCLLRNMLFKAVIRVGAGYFRRDGRFFLSSGGGEPLESITHRKIETALVGLERSLEIDEL